MPIMFKKADKPDPKPVTIPTTGKTVQPTALVHKEHVKDKGKTALSQEMTEVPAGGPVPASPLAVGVEMARVFSDGNYGSYRVAVSLVMPHDGSYHSIEQAYAYAKEFVDQKMLENLKDTPGEK